MIGNELQRFAQNNLVLGYSDAERASIDKSIGGLMGCLNRKLEIPYCDMIVFGSYTRNTILPRAYDLYSDIDILVAMGYVEYWSRQDVEPCRKRLRDAISGTYSTSYVVRDFPCVKLELNHIKFDIVPALKEQTNYGIAYKIPSKGGSWIYTEPNDINVALEKGNKEAGGNKLRSIIRLCKHWNSARENKPLDSYELEKMIIHNYLLWSSIGDYGYDRFLMTLLNAIEAMSYYITTGADTRSCVQKVRNYMYMNNDSGQRTWMRHLLPGFGS